MEIIVDIGNLICNLEILKFFQAFLLLYIKEEVTACTHLNIRTAQSILS